MAMYRRRRAGSALLEVVLGLFVISALIAGVVRWSEWQTERERAQLVAERVSTISKAASAYVVRNRAALWTASKAGKGPTENGSIVRVVVARTAAAQTPLKDATAAIPSLQGAGYLPSSFVDTNPYGQRTILAVRAIGAEVVDDPSDPDSVRRPGRIEAMIYTTGGTAIPDRQLGMAAQAIGASGGFVAAAPVSGGVGRVVGTRASWNASVSDWQTGTDPLRAGSMASVMAVDDGAVVSDFLARGATGVREANTMRTTLIMGGNDILGLRDLAANKDIAFDGNLRTVQDLRAGRDVTVGEDLIVMKGDVTVAGTANVKGDLVAANMTTGGDVAVGGIARFGPCVDGSTAPVGPCDASNGTEGGTLTSTRLVDSDSSSIFDLSGSSSLSDLSTTNLSVDALAFGTAIGSSGAPDPSRPRLGDWLRHGIRAVKAVGPAGVRDGPPSYAEARCPSSDGAGRPYVRIGCGGGRSDASGNVIDNCSEQDCGVIGTMPTTGAGWQGCRTGVDADGGARPLAVAYCMSNVEYDASSASSPAGGRCPDWAPGVYPKCVYLAPDKCPDWAPGIYPQCVVRECPEWAPGVYPRCAATAKPPKNCLAPWGSVIRHGSSVLAWDDDESFNCRSQSRSCLNGTLSGTSDYRYRSCDQIRLQRVTCTSNAGKTQSTTAYSNVDPVMVRAPSNGGTWVMFQNGPYLNCDDGDYFPINQEINQNPTHSRICRSYGGSGTGSYLHSCSRRDL